MTILREPLDRENVRSRTLERLLRAIWPFLLVEFVILFLITYAPGVALFVPRMFGLAR